MLTELELKWRNYFAEQESEKLRNQSSGGKKRKDPESSDSDIEAIEFNISVAPIDKLTSPVIAVSSDEDEVQIVSKPLKKVKSARRVRFSEEALETDQPSRPRKIAESVSLVSPVKHSVYIEKLIYR